MKRITLIFFALFFYANGFSQSRINDILQDLDEELKLSATYTLNKEKSIDDLKLQFKNSTISAQERYNINYTLYQEYRSFKTDSAIKYVKENTIIASSLNNTELILDCKLQLAYLYSIAGLYIDGIQILDDLQNTELSNQQKIDYYECRKRLYTNYGSQHAKDFKYNHLSSLYRDSLFNHLDSSTNHYKTVLAEKLQVEGKFQEAKHILFTVLNTLNNKNHEHAIVTSAIGNLFKKEGNLEMQKEYFALSAISDIKNAIKENTSLQSLAIALFETGDIERSYQYSKHSMEDAIFCNAPLRTLEVSRLYPIITSAYQDKAEKQKKELLSYLILISILSMGLIIAIIYALVQVKKLAKNRKELYFVNDQLQQLNKDLQEVNAEIKETNSKLKEANRIKEEYIGNFLDLCSSYINKLEDYRKMLHKKASTGKLEELFTILKSQNLVDHELKLLYKNFDNIFLHLYPNFIEEFNSLLIEEERFEIKSDEILNTELRIFALVRLGIHDSSRIASFLRYSASTVYNYRTKVRNKAGVPRENFENLVMQIGITN
jgi:cell division protein FtsB